MKLKEWLRLRSFYNILTKERRFGPQRMINGGEVTKKYMEIPMEEKGYFLKVCLCRILSVLALHLQRLELLFPSWSGWWGGARGGGHLPKGKLMPCF